MAASAVRGAWLRRDLGVHDRFKPLSAHDAHPFVDVTAFATAVLYQPVSRCSRAIVAHYVVTLPTPGLEFAYSQAPAPMKSVVTSLFLLTTAFGNILTGKRPIAGQRLSSTTFHFPVVVVIDDALCDCLPVHAAAGSLRPALQLHRRLVITRECVPAVCSAHAR